MLTGRLIITATTHTEALELLSGRAEVAITTVDAGIDDELVRHTLRPLLIEALTPVASTDPTVEASGALVRVFIQRPAKELT